MTSEKSNMYRNQQKVNFTSLKDMDSQSIIF